jgi:hypothetical protein
MRRSIKEWFSVLELTTRFRGITTGTGARGQIESRAAVNAAMAHLRYIARPSAAIEFASAGLSLTGHQPDGVDRELLRKSLRVRLEARAGSGGKVGRRVAEKIIVSLPLDWDQAARVEAMRRVVEHIAPPGSEALAVAYSHGDKPGNPHFHVLAVDGRESLEGARNRRPDAQRVRRRDVIRLGDRGRPKALRGEIAAIINDVAKEMNLSAVEWRSFKDRGIKRRPGRHEGVEQRARVAREALSKPRRPIRRRGRVSRVAADQAMRRAVRVGLEIIETLDAHDER